MLFKIFIASVFATITFAAEIAQGIPQTIIRITNPTFHHNTILCMTIIFSDDTSLDADKLIFPGVQNNQNEILEYKLIIDRKRISSIWFVLFNHTKNTPEIDPYATMIFSKTFRPHVSMINEVDFSVQPSEIKVDTIKYFLPPVYPDGW